MGIFDFLFKGPSLKKDSADLMAINIAMDLYRNNYSLQDLVINAEKILEHHFQRDYRNQDCSIDSEQSKQILRLAILYFENDKGYLEELGQYRSMVAEAHKPNKNGLRLKVSLPSFRYSGILNTNYEEHLTLFEAP